MCGDLTRARWGAWYCGRPPLLQVVQSSSEGDEEKAMELIVPGRVYYVKPRKLHGAATIKEVGEEERRGATPLHRQGTAEAALPT